MAHVSFYTVGTLYGQEIFFPGEAVCCKNCFRAYSDGMGRAKCPVLDRLIFDGNTRYDDCPIEFTGEIRGTKKGD